MLIRPQRAGLGYGALNLRLFSVCWPARRLQVTCFLTYPVADKRATPKEEGEGSKQMPERKEKGNGQGERYARQLHGVVGPWK